ncbi:MAG: hypothetical protein M9951_06600 [Burkholderiaceae bacterium]|nr:hypothetical protein [Burkholderiaceae bacterium]
MIPKWHAAHLGGMVLALGVVMSPVGAEAAVSIPGCAQMDAWAANAESSPMWSPNDIGSRKSITGHLFSDEATRLFGAPVLQWTVDDAAAVRRAMIDCRRANKDRGVGKSYNFLQSQISSRLSNYLKDLAEARAAIDSALDGLQAVPASAPLLRFYTLMSKASDKAAYGRMNEAANQLGAQSRTARPLVMALRDMPTEEIRASVEPQGAERADAMRQAVTDDLVASVAGIPASGRGLEQIARAQTDFPKSYGEVLSAEQMAAIQKALAERKRAIGEEIVAITVKQIGQSSQGADAFDDLERRMNVAILPALEAKHSEAILAAARARREEVTGILLARMEDNLKGLDDTQASIDAIDREVMPWIGSLPAGTEAMKAKLTDRATARRAEILEEVEDDESGDLEKRVYQSDNGQTKLEFVDDDRVFATAHGQTVAGTYTQEKDGRIVLTLDGQSRVVKREGQRIKGWTTPLLRVK